jgi:photosystem II stability/assembly factor-like uncharacterized protein
MAIIFEPQPILMVGVERQGGWRYAEGQVALPPTPALPVSSEGPDAVPLPAGSWQPIADLPRQINVLAVDPANPQVFYAGTGESGTGSGVYKSEDGGLTWRLAAAGLPNEDVIGLLLSQGTPGTLYAVVGVRGDVFASTDGAQSWTRLGDSGTFGGFHSQLYSAPGRGSPLFMVARPGGLMRSQDGGHTWVPIGEGLPKNEHEVFVMSLAIDPTDASTVYAGTGGWVGGGHGVYKSSDGGETWSPANRGMLDYCISALAVDPLQPQTLYAGGYTGELFKTTDGGQSWLNLTERLRIHEYNYPGSIHSIILDPARPETVYVLANYTGVLFSSDGGQKWRLLGKPGEADQPTFTAMEAALTTGPVLVVGIERGGAWRYGTSQSSQAISGAAAAAQSAAPATPTVAALTDRRATTPTPAAQAVSTPTLPPPRAAPQPTATPAPPPANCPDPRAMITSPANGATIRGVVPFVGTAAVDGLLYYKFEYKPADAPTWQFLTQFEGKTVTDGKLMDFYTSTIAPGVYDFRLIVVEQTGNYLVPCEIRVSVER